MRILLTHHGSLGESPSGEAVNRLSQGLRSAGHDVQGLIVTQSPPQPGSFPIRHVRCGTTVTDSELKLNLPLLDSATCPTFETLADSQLAEYRDVLRKALDEVVHKFDPHLIHGQHIDILGHLALEAGVPYVMTAWGPELEACRNDARYQRFAQEAAENAGRILVRTEELRQQLLTCFDDLEAESITVVDGAQDSMSTLKQTETIYREVLTARFGPGYPP